MTDLRTDNCSHCGFPLPRHGSGLRHYGTHTAHQEHECLRLLHAEIAALKDAVHSARADEAHCWASRVDVLEAQLRRLHAENAELLEALKDLLADTQHADHHCDDAAWCPVMKARAAIAKAEGKK